MTTTVTKSISLTGTPDYSTLQTWEDGAPANLVTSDQVWQGKVDKSTDNFSAAGNSLTVSGSTVDSTRYKELTTNAGASFRDNANVQTNALRFNASNGASIADTAGYSQPVSVGEEFFRISNLQLANTSGVSLGQGCAILSSLGTSTSALLIDNCILESNSGTAGVIKGFGSNHIVRNSLIVQRKSGASVAMTWQNAAKIYNCTIAVPNDLTAATNGVDVSNYGGTSGVFENVALFKCTNVKTGTSSPTVTTSYTDIASPPTGWTNTAYATGSGAKFQNITDATRDFRIASGSSLVDVGTTDSTNAANDIAGTARSAGTYDVGCWELVSAALNLWAQSCL